MINAEILCWLLGTSVLKKCRFNSHFISNFEPILIGPQFGTPYKHQPNGEGVQYDASEMMYVPRHAPQRVDVLGTAQAMLQNFPQSYAAYTEALSLDPNNAGLWFN